MLDTSIYSFSHNIFQNPFLKGVNPFMNKPLFFEIVLCNFFYVWKSLKFKVYHLEKS